MQLTTTLLTTLFSVLAVNASPVPAPEPATDSTSKAVSMMVTSTPQWTITNMQRQCNETDTICTWHFGIDTHTSPATACSFQVKAASAADRTNSYNHVCGPYTVSTGWSGQFGAGNGFTTLAVVQNAEKRIIYPGYTDKQLASGKVVKPDQSYAPANLP